MPRPQLNLKPALIGMGLFVGLWLVLDPVFQRQRSKDNLTVCQSNLKSIALAYQMYVQDYDEKFPPLPKGNQGWVFVLQPYTLGNPYFRCPSATGLANASLSTDYFMNVHLISARIDRLKSPQNIFLNGDGLPDEMTNTYISALPSNWIREEGSPALRHISGANYAFVDGHVKWLRPKNATIDPVKSGNATFSVN